MKLVACLILIHSWYPAECCSDRDCRPVPCEQLVEHGDGSVEYRGLSFTGTMVRNSLDGQCHVCLDEHNARPYCVFIQNNS